MHYGSVGTGSPPNLTPEQFGAFIHAEIEKNAKLIKLIRAKTE